jgi:hypothetical protein
MGSAWSHRIVQRRSDGAFFEVMTGSGERPGARGHHSGSRVTEAYGRASRQTGSPLAGRESGHIYGEGGRRVRPAADRSDAPHNALHERSLTG